MSFNSIEYLIFLSCVALIFWGLIRYTNIRLIFLLAASYYFYACHNHFLILLIIISTQIDFICGRLIATSEKLSVRKVLLAISIISNLGILAAFKYLNFISESLVGLAGLFGLKMSWVDLHIVLPVGISFYTFQSMSYTIDVYRGHIQAEKSWFKFATFVAFFPQLVAGPIVKAAYFLPQLKKMRMLSDIRIADEPPEDQSNAR